MDILNWLNNSISGEFVFTALISMLPVVELRGGIPFGVGVGLPMHLAVLASVIGNMLPVPFLILFTRRVFQWLRRHIPFLDGTITKLEKRAESKRELVYRYKLWGLLILVAIPLPGTGAWTGALIASLMGMRFKKSFFSIVGGVFVAGIIMALGSYGFVSFFKIFA